MYSFLEKANNEPDLEDAVKYLLKIIYSLKEIQNRIKNSTNLSSNLEVVNINHTCDQILNKHLPELIDDYCNFTVKYRNEVKIVQENDVLTHKQLLLKNLAKLMEETGSLEKTLNENNTNHFLAKSRVINYQYGVQNTILLSGDEKPNKIELANEFDYEKYSRQETDSLFEKLPKRPKTSLAHQIVSEFENSLAQVKPNTEKHIENADIKIQPKENAISINENEPEVSSVNETLALNNIIVNKDLLSNYLQILTITGLFFLVICLLSMAHSSSSVSDNSKNEALSRVNHSYQVKNNYNYSYDENMNYQPTIIPKRPREYAENIMQSFVLTQQYIHKSYHDNYKNIPEGLIDLYEPDMHFRDKGVNLLTKPLSEKEFSLVATNVNKATCEAFQVLNETYNPAFQYKNVPCVEGANSIEIHSN